MRENIKRKNLLYRQMHTDSSGNLNLNHLKHIKWEERNGINSSEEGS